MRFPNSTTGHTARGRQALNGVPEAAGEVAGGADKYDHKKPIRRYIMDTTLRALTAAVAAAIRAVACDPRSLGGRHESDEVARKRGLLDIAIISTMRDALLRRGEAAQLRWKDIQFCEDGTGRLTIRHPQIDQGFVTFLSPQAVEDLLAIRPADVDPESSVFNLTGRSISRRIPRRRQGRRSGLRILQTQLQDRHGSRSRQYRSNRPRDHAGGTVEVASNDG